MSQTAPASIATTILVLRTAVSQTFGLSLGSKEATADTISPLPPTATWVSEGNTGRIAFSLGTFQQI